MRRIANVSAILSLAVCGSSRAIILYGDGTGHTTAPTGAFANSGWQYEGQFGSNLGTAIGPHAVITSEHIITSTPGDNSQASGSFVLNGTSYSIVPNSTYHVPGRDLIVFKVNNGSSGNAMPYWAPIYSESTSGNGSIVGKTMVMIGRGTERGTEIKVTSPARSGEGADGLVRGWNWGAFNSVQRWGTNVITSYASDTFPHEYFAYTFDLNGLTDEATISPGDSGGGNFIKNSITGAWQLAGVNALVDADYGLTSAGSSGSGAMFDFRDLYKKNSNGMYVLQSGGSLIPELAYNENVSDIALSQLSAYVPHAGDVNADGKVNALDFNAIASHFGVGSGAIWTQGDLNYDGAVNTSDFMILANNFGYSGVAADGGIGGAALGSAVPEPTGAAVLLLGLFAARRRR